MPDVQTCCDTCTPWGTANTCGIGSCSLSDRVSVAGDDPTPGAVGPPARRDGPAYRIGRRRCQTATHDRRHRAAWLRGVGARFPPGMVRQGCVSLMAIDACPAGAAAHLQRGAARAIPRNPMARQPSTCDCAATDYSGPRLTGQMPLPKPGVVCPSGELCGDRLRLEGPACGRRRRCGWSYWRARRWR
jgi:hypothetical protein